MNLREIEFEKERISGLLREVERLQAEIQQLKREVR